ncbi:hypothetical protein AEA09_10250 [Lysinibacillus contaminans]|uniref:DUF3139 domain-containing protein n=1 Tax=Lysinibacillus contaminans TaxID=1293441 RepID=A0ABR5K1T4_9BACI|nr:chitobiase/beta-hexosaminidase C-terminal domain-containing protein [Lysinibacillus contaminans]KOS68885.1 hypothetical protein AEA09_10250 [Lysinibacillus contaminans]
MRKSLALLLLILLIVPFAYVEQKKRIYENRTQQYLTKEMEYAEADIKSLECKWHFFGLPNYWVSVIFTDEENIEYVYFVHDREQPLQFEYYSLDGSTPTSDELKHYEPHD